MASLHPNERSSFSPLFLPLASLFALDPCLAEQDFPPFQIINRTAEADLTTEFATEGLPSNGLWGPPVAAAMPSTATLAFISAGYLNLDGLRLDGEAPVCSYRGLDRSGGPQVPAATGGRPFRG